MRRRDAYPRVMKGFWRYRRRDAAVANLRINRRAIQRMMVPSYSVVSLSDSFDLSRSLSLCASLPLSASLRLCLPPVKPTRSSVTAYTGCMVPGVRSLPKAPWAGVPLSRVKGEMGVGARAMGWVERARERQ